MREGRKSIRIPKCFPTVDKIKEKSEKLNKEKEKKQEKENEKRE